MPRGRPRNQGNKLLTVVVMGRPAQTIAVSSTTKVSDVASELGITFSKVEATKTQNGSFREIQPNTAVNGYFGVLFTPKVDGGRI